MPAPEPSVLAFCHLRKTGGITFNQILRREFGIHHLDAITRYPDGKNIYRDVDLKKDLWIYPRIRSIAGHGLRPFLDYGEFANRMRWITILRNPTERYVSHFIHHVEHFDYREPFNVWMDIPKHQNDQTVTIAGKPDIDKAKALLSNFFWVGFTGDYAESLKMLEIALKHSISTHSYRRSNVARGKKFDKAQLIEEFETQIRERNRLDWELYEFAKREIWPRQQAWSQQAIDLERSSPKSRGVWPARIKRNLLYKPYLLLNRLWG